MDTSTSGAGIMMIDTNTEEATTISSTMPLLIAAADIPSRFDVVTYNLVETKQYQMALELNNIGISLLEYEAYSDALQTLKKTNDIMGILSSKATLSVDDTTFKFDTDTTSLSIQRMNKYIHIAQDRLRKCQIRRRSKARICNFDVIVLNDGNFGDLQDAADVYPIRNTGYVIRIDTTCKYYSSNFLLQTSVIAMNYAIAQRCMINTSSLDTSSSSQRSSINQREAVYMRHSYKLFKFALGLLQQEAAAALSVPSDYYLVCDYGPNMNFVLDDVAMQERIDLMMIFAVQGLMHMALDLDLESEAHGYYCALGDLHLGHIRCHTSANSVLTNLAPAA